MSPQQQREWQAARKAAKQRNRAVHPHVTTDRALDQFVEAKGVKTVVLVVDTRLSETAEIDALVANPTMKAVLALGRKRNPSYVVLSGRPHRTDEGAVCMVVPVEGEGGGVDTLLGCLEMAFARMAELGSTQSLFTAMVGPDLQPRLMAVAAKHVGAVGGTQ